MSNCKYHYHQILLTQINNNNKKRMKNLAKKKIKCIEKL